VAWSAAERPDHGEAEVTGAEEEKGRRRWRSSGDAGLGLGFRWVGAALCRAAEPHWHAGPGRGSSPEISGPLRRRRKGKRERGADAGADLAERERERGESGARAGRLAPTSGPGVAAREREREEGACGVAGLRKGMG
jgi:hypothetical protein